MPGDEKEPFGARWETQHDGTSGATSPDANVHQLFMQTVKMRAWSELLRVPSGQENGANTMALNVNQDVGCT